MYLHPESARPRQYLLICQVCRVYADEKDATEEEILAAVGAGAGTGINDGAAAAPGVELAESASPSAATASPSSAVTASATPSPAASASASPTAVGTATAQPGTSDPSSKAAYKPAGTGAQAGIGAVAGGNNGAAAGAQGIDVGPCSKSRSTSHSILSTIYVGWKACLHPSKLRHALSRR